MADTEGVSVEATASMAKAFTESVTGVVTATKRERNSVYGNPNYSVVIREASGREGIYRTSANGDLNYGITNAEFRDVPHEFGLTRAGRLNGHSRVAEGE